jgi:putative salt-induced outer membrane protein
MTSSRYLTLSLTTLALLRTVSAFADDPPPPPQDKWTGKGQIGYLSSHGNTDANSANANIDAFYYHGPWKHEVYLGGLYGKSAGIVSAERWEVREQTNYDFSPKMFVFGSLRDEHDMFSGFHYQATVSTGLGWKVVDTNETKLTTQVGVGYRRLQPETLVKDPNTGAVTARIRQDSEGNAVATAGLDFLQVLTSTTTLTNKLLVESGSDNTSLHNDLALSVKVSNKIAVSLGYSVQNNSSPPAGLKKLDTIATANIVVSF